MFKKIYIIIFILIFMFVSCSTFVYAGDINMNLQNSNTSVESNTSSPLNALSSLPESSMGLTNILNILLIAVGILLILLAIAILIRLR